MKYIALIIFTFLCVFTYAATEGTEKDENDDDGKGKIAGIVVDNQNETPMEFANIAIYNIADSSLITGGITNEKGEFEIRDIGFGDYFLEANFIGFEKSTIKTITLNKENRTESLGKINLSPSAVALGEVNVVADKAAVEYKLDKKVVNVSQVISAIGGTAINVLESTPSVQVDIEGNVSLRGSSNFTVLIDGRPSVLSGTEALRQIPSSAIESIEIITNPSAKYDPEGTTGIINLVMKKNSMNGLNGIVNASVGTRDKYRGDFTLNYRTEKFNVFAGADWRDEASYGSMRIERATTLGDTTAFLDIDGQRNYIRSGNNFKAGVDLYLSGNTTLTLSGEQGTSKGKRDGRDGETHSYTIPASENIYSVTEEYSLRESNFYSLNMNFQHKFNDKGHRIEAYAIYSSEETDDEETESEILSDSNFNPTGEYLDRVSGLETEEESEFEFKLDYTWPFSEDGRLEAGLQNSLEREIEGLAFRDFNLATNQWEINEEFSSTTDFRRDIHALYTTFSNKMGGLQYMAGLRGELILRDIKNTNVEQTSTLNRFDVFPSLHLSFPVKEKTELMASYGRRINRPSGRDLDPIPNYYNRYTIRYGNPDLKPEYTNSFELGAMQRLGEGRSYLSLDAFHRVTNNKIDGIQTLRDDGVFILQTDNFDKDYATGLEMTGNIEFTEWLLLNASLTMYNYKISGVLNGESFTRKSTNWNGRGNTTFKFSDNSRTQIMAYYRGPSVSAQGESKASFYTSISYRHEFLKKKTFGHIKCTRSIGNGKV